MSILSKVKSAVKKGVSNLKGNLGVIGDSIKKASKSTPKTASVISGKIDLSKTSSGNDPVSKIIGSTISTKTGGATTPSSSVKSYTSNTPGGQKVAAANISPSTSYSALSSKSSGGSSSSSKSNTSSSSSSKTSSSLNSTPSYTPSLKSLNEPVSASELSTTSAIGTGTNGQTNTGVSNINPFTGTGQKTDAVISSYEDEIKRKREEAAAEREKEMGLKDYQDQIDQAAEDTRVDRKKIEKQVGLKGLEQEAAQVKAEILGIKAQFEAQRQSLIGQGRGIPEAVIGGQQEALDRQEAIKTMPLLARYQIANDNYLAAKETVDNFIADEQAYLNRVYQTKVATINKAFDLATDKEKDAVQDFKDSYTRQIQAQKDANDLKRDIIGEYLKNEQTPPNSLLNYDTSSPNAQDDLTNMYGSIAPGAGSTGSSGFKDSDTEIDVRGDVADLLPSIRSGKLKAEDAYADLRVRYSPSEVSDEALKGLLGIGQDSAGSDAGEPISKIESDISNILNSSYAQGFPDGEQKRNFVKSELQKRGYKPQEITDSSVGSTMERISQGIANFFSF